MTPFSRNLLMSAAHNLFGVLLHKLLTKVAQGQPGSALAVRPPDRRNENALSPPDRSLHALHPATLYAPSPAPVQPVSAPPPPRRRRKVVTETVIFEEREW